MVAIGNFLFKYRNALFPFMCFLLFLPGRPIFGDAMVAAGAGAVLALLGQSIRALTIGLDYIVRGGRQGRVYADDLVVTGIYRHTRNPMYVGNVLIAVGLAIASNSWTALGIAVPLVLVAYSAIIAAEEKFLAVKFGTAFAEYCRDVPRWLPRLSGLGETLSGAVFHWRRVVVKEYGTPAGWIAILCGVVLYNIWWSGDWSTRRTVVNFTAVVIASTFLLWVVARVLKKSGTLRAD